MGFQNLKIDEPHNYINTLAYPFNGSYPFHKNCGNVFPCGLLSGTPNNSNSFNYYGININNKKKPYSHNNSFKIKKKKSQGNYTSFNKQILQTSSPKKSKYKFSKNFNLCPEQSQIEDFSRYLSSLPCQPYEYVCTQKGAKEIQKNLSKFHLECKTILINILSSYLPIIMTNIYGNYFIQEFIKTCNDSQIILILNYISRNFVEIAQDYSGTHVLQAIIDKARNNIVEEQLILNSIIGKEMSMAFNSNATHVLQKIITTIPEERRQNLNEILFQNLHQLCFDSNGICLVKKMIKETKSQENKNKITMIITEKCVEISKNPFGNYVIQYLFEEWELYQIYPMINILIENICKLSIQKYSSNVSEKLIELVDDSQKIIIFSKLFGERDLVSVLKSKYGRFVLQKAVKIMQNSQKDLIKQTLSKLNLSSLKDVNYIKSFLASS